MTKTTKFDFEKNYAELESIVEEMEKISDLDKSLKLYENGLDLISKCKKRLQDVENKVTVLKEKFSEEE